MKLYLDTSIFGGFFEPEFQLWTHKLIDDILDGHYIAVITDLTLLELEKAPNKVRDLADRVIKSNAQFISIDPACINLSNNYLKEKIITPKFQSDALHIAAATI